MRLINTIEIDPYDFLAKDEQESNSDIIELPEDRNQFWKKCMSARNLGRLEAVRKGSYLVDISTINDDELQEVIKNELRDVDLSDFEEQVVIISGGIVLEENHRIYIEPTCCGDIGNIVEWEDIHTKLPGEWNQLWIGHPWIYYRTDQQVIEFSGYSESTREELKNTPLLISVSQQDLQRELQKIRLQQDHFELRIQKTLAKMGIDNCERIANLMTGNV